MLWPVSQLFGGGSWSLFVSTFVLHLLAMATALWLAFRRGGTTLMLAMGLVLVVVAHTYGLATLSQPWNPYLPLMAWLVVLLAAWSVLDDDLPMLPVLVFAGFVLHADPPALPRPRRRARGRGVHHRGRRRHHAASRRRGPAAGSCCAGASSPWGSACWCGCRRSSTRSSTRPGNLTLIWRDLVNPPQAAGGVHQGVRLLLVHLNPWTVVGTRALDTTTNATIIPGVVFAVVWLASAVVAWRIRLRTVVNLDVVLGRGHGAGVGLDEQDLRTAVLLPHPVGLGHVRADDARGVLDRSRSSSHRRDLETAQRPAATSARPRPPRRRGPASPASVGLVAAHAALHRDDVHRGQPRSRSPPRGSTPPLAALVAPPSRRSAGSDPAASGPAVASWSPGATRSRSAARPGG